MALIMFSGMFGFGEMVSYISFMGNEGGVGRKVLMWRTGDNSKSATLNNFPFSDKPVELCSLDILIQATI